MEEKINRIIESFNDWHLPWTFIDSVLSNLSLSENEKAIIIKIWNVVLSEEYWKLSYLKECSRVAKENLSRQFPWLSDRSCEHFVNAASYQWK